MDKEEEIAGAKSAYERLMTQARRRGGFKSHKPLSTKPAKGLSLSEKQRIVDLRNKLAMDAFYG